MEGVSPIKIDVLKTGPQGLHFVGLSRRAEEGFVESPAKLLSFNMESQDSPMFHHPMVFPNV